MEKSLIAKSLYNIETHDMHTAGEPLRIIKSGFPILKGATILEKQAHAKQQYDDYRKLLMNEPRGHKDMYGAILMQETLPANKFDVIFLNNEGYSPMCGHAIIALGRYVIDFKLATPISPETVLDFHCPCGPVKAFVEYWNGESGRVCFHSVPAFVDRLGAEISIEKYGFLKVDIAFGGAYYAFISDKELSIDIKTTPLPEIIDIAAQITDSVKKQISIIHPESKDLSYLYGTIITDGKDAYSESPTTNICVFADRQVDRSPTGSGVTARIALQMAKGLISLNQEREFRSIIGTSFKGKAVKETLFHDKPAVVVEVSGMAYHTGDHTFYLEQADGIGQGFQLPR